ncbi:hypothetical protein [Glaciibacter psychrotolerans]|uniref:hypothetical protein n=1 Tax=Glaciibacter psychrotolerans TaxID=670054 RepID=UPI001C535D5C|nr:hypothetical protein [Leifsonia psychrotolerans]
MRSGGWLAGVSTGSTNGVGSTNGAGSTAGARSTDGAGSTDGVGRITPLIERVEISCVGL